MDLINEQHIAGFQIGQDRRQITCLGQDRARGHAEIHPQFACHDLRQGGLAQARGTVKQGMIHRLATTARTFNKDPQIRPGLSLANELGNPLWAQGAIPFTRGIFGNWVWAQGWVSVDHFEPPLPARSTSLPNEKAEQSPSAQG